MGSINLGPVHLDRFRYGPYGHCKSPHSYPFLSIPGNQCFLIRFHIWWNRLRGFSCRETWNVRPRNRFWLKSQKHGQLVHFVASSRIQMGCYIPSSAGFGSACWRIQSAGGIAMFAFCDRQVRPVSVSGIREKDKKHSRRCWSQGAESGRKPAGFLHLHRPSRCMLGAQTL